MTSIQVGKVLAPNFNFRAKVPKYIREVSVQSYIDYQVAEPVAPSKSVLAAAAAKILPENLETVVAELVQYIVKTPGTQVIVTSYK
jgi:hypothetical protein